MDNFFVQTAKDSELETLISRFAPKVRQILDKQNLPAPSVYVGQDSTPTQALDLAMDLLETNQIEAAGVCLAQASQYYPEELEIWILLAALARIQGRLSRAEHILRHAASIDFDPQIWTELSQLKKASSQILQGKNIDLYTRFLKQKHSIQTI